MKRWTVVCASVAFFLFFWLALADITFTDISRWGIMRRMDVFPGVNATLVYPTGGVLRVVETGRGVDSNAVVVTVLTNVVWDGGILATGVYRSIAANQHKTWTRYALTNNWTFDRGRPLLRFEASGVSNSLGWSPATTNFVSPLLETWPFNAESVEFGDGDTFNVFTAGVTRTLIYTFANGWTGTAEGVLSNATEVTLQADSETCFGSLVLRVATNVCVLHAASDPRLLSAAADSGLAAPPWFMTNFNGAAASAVFGERYVATTNDFISAERLQDALDDMQLQISEAIEAHVQLLHP